MEQLHYSFEVAKTNDTIEIELLLSILFADHFIGRAQACAGYIGYPFEKSRDCASKIPFSHCQYEEIDARARNIENRQVTVQRLVTQMPRQPSRGMRRSPCSLERKRDRERNTLDTAQPIQPSLLHAPFVNALPRLGCSLVIMV